MKKGSNPVDDFRHKVARDFCTAYTANKMMVTFRTAQNYTKGEVGDFWLLLADAAIEAENQMWKDVKEVGITDLEPISELEN